MDLAAVAQLVSALQSGQLNLNLNASNTSLPYPQANVATPTEGLLIPHQLYSLVSYFMSFSAITSWLKLLIIGALLECCRRVWYMAWVAIKNFFWITVTVDESDDSGTWLMFWLSRHKVFHSARTIDISTRTFGINALEVSSADTADDIYRGQRPISYLPSQNMTYTLWYKSRFVTVTRNMSAGSAPYRKEKKLQIHMLTRDHEVLRQLLGEAKKLYYDESKHLISIYTASSSGSWSAVCKQNKRPLRSIILNPGVMELVMNDAKDFLASKNWYAERGIPHRRGYLLYGAPGSGKTSLIHGIAGELSLEVYILSLTRTGMDDPALNSTIAALPERCIVLIEDIDAAFHRGIIKRDIPDPEKGDDTNEDDPDNKEHTSDNSGKDVGNVPGMGITLSGLLNALDGIGAQEGRIFFATTNDYRALDPALCRPGRLDLHIKFELASKYQCRELFARFYLPNNPQGGVQGNENGQSESENENEDEDEGEDAVHSVAASAPSSPLLKSDPSGHVYGGTHLARAPRLTPGKAAKLGERFAAAIPDRSLSMATLQGYLMTYKTRPYDAVADIPAWVERKLLEKKAATNVSPDAPDSVR